MSLMFNKAKGRDRELSQLRSDVIELLRNQRLQGEAHSAIMGLIAEVRKEVASLHERLSFNGRPKL